MLIIVLDDKRSTKCHFNENHYFILSLSLLIVLMRFLSREAVKLFDNVGVDWLKLPECGVEALFYPMIGVAMGLNMWYLEIDNELSFA